MQIHELTQSKLNEGIVDALKVALSRDPGIDGLNYKQAKQYLATSKATKAIAQKAQQAWEVYAKQLEQFAAKSPTAQPGPTAKSTTPNAPEPAVPTVKVGNLTITRNPDGTWVDNSGRKIVVPNDVAELEKRWKQQELLKAQNKQMSSASGIKEAAPVTAPGGIARRSATRNAPVSPAAPAPVATTPAPITQVDSLTAFRNRTDGRYQQALKSFVQKNLLSGMPYNKLANGPEIDQIIKSLSAPNLESSKTAELWQQLALAASVAYTVPQSAGGLEAPNPETDKKSTPDAVDTDTLTTAIKNKAKVDASGLSNIGRAVRQEFTDNENTIKSTGNPAVDTLLRSMGFSI